MKKRNFIAKDWLQNRHVAEVRVPSEETAVPKLPSFSPRRLVAAFQDPDFRPSEYLDLEWLSENLSSKSSYILTQTLDLVSNDVLGQMENSLQFPRKLRSQIYNEFLDFSDLKNINSSMDNVDIFWTALHDSKSKYRKELNLFKKELSAKIAVLYLLKVRFFKVLSVFDNESFLPRELLSPHSLFLRYFKKSSSNELNSSILKSNHYSWYTPSFSLLSSICDYFETCDDLNYLEILNVLSSRVSGLRIKSHALSHKNTGLFINCLLLNFFHWLENNQAKGNYCPISRDLRVVSSKFSGDFLPDHSCAHWFAQYNNSYFKWDEIIAPFFKDSRGYLGVMMGLLNEVEYYTFLVKVSSFYCSSPVSFISQCVKSSQRNTKEDFSLQKNLMIEGFAEEKTTYDRLVVSYLTLPKKNAHYHLIQTITDKYDELKNDGYLVVLSACNLFVHSQRSRVKSLLKKFNLEGMIQLQGVHSKGEFPPYIFMFSKKAQGDTEKGDSSSAKQTCFNFRINADLESFKDFSLITDELNSFFDKHLEDTPAFFRSDFGKKFQFEFYQDAIIDGRLIHSGSEEVSQITHPSFFKNMLQNCLPFNYFYELHSIDIENLIRGAGESHLTEQLDFTSDLNAGFEDFGKDQLVVIFNFNNPADSKLEMITFDLLKGKAFQYGMTSCFYYRIVPKFKGLNANIFREYFSSQLGRQISQMSISGSYHQAKSKISNLLIPKFFASRKQFPEHLKECFHYLLLSEEQILENSFSDLNKKVVEGRSLFCSLSKQYGHEVISYLSLFKSTLHNCAHRFNSSKVDTKNVDFSKRELSEKLSKLPTTSFYPNNQDVFLEFYGDHKELSNPLTKMELRFKDNDESELDLLSHDQKILTVHCSHCLGAFLSFLGPKVYNYSIIDILKNLRIPSDNNLKNTVSEYIDRSKSLTDAYSQVESILSDIFRQAITS